MDFVFYLTNHFHEIEYDLEEATVTSFCCQFDLLMESDGKSSIMHGYLWKMKILLKKRKGFIFEHSKNMLYKRLFFVLGAVFIGLSCVVWYGGSH